MILWVILNGTPGILYHFQNLTTFIFVQIPLSRNVTVIELFRCSE